MMWNILEKIGMAYLALYFIVMIPLCTMGLLGLIFLFFKEVIM